MKFIVQPKPYSNEVTVKLAHETKDKIKKIALWTSIGVLAVGSIVDIRRKNNQDRQEAAYLEE